MVSSRNRKPPCGKKLVSQRLCTMRRLLCLYSNRPLRELSGLIRGNTRVEIGWRQKPAADDDVEAEGAIACMSRGWVANDAIAIRGRHDEEDEVLLVQRLVWKVHLRHEADARPDNGEMHVRWTPPADVRARDVRARLDRPQLIPAVVIGDEPAEAVEVRIERRVVATRVDDM